MKKIKTAPFLPEEFKVEQISENEANIVAYPFETGYAVSLAHPLRRFLLSSSIGFAPVGMKIEGATHEFDSIRGMLEDISEFIINLKSIRFRLKNDEKFAEVNYTFSGPKEIVGSDLDNDDVEVVTPNNFLATLNEDATLSFSLLIYQGIGYVPSEEIRDELPDGYIPLDAYFTPVRKATYEIENVLVEDNPNYEKVVLNIVTDGQIDPVTAFRNALEVMYSQMAVFKSEVSVSAPNTIERVEDSPELKVLMKKIDEMGLSARSFNCLDRSGIKVIGQIVMMSENDLKNVKNLGKKSLDEIKEKLVEINYPIETQLSDELTIALKKKLEAE